MGEAFIIKNGGVDKLNNAVAIIGVTYPQGAKCTCASADGEILLSAENTTGIWAFGVPSAGTWTITCEADDGNRIQRNVTTIRGHITEIDVEFLVPVEYQAVTYIKLNMPNPFSYVESEYGLNSYPFDVSLRISAENLLPRSDECLVFYTLGGIFKGGIISPWYSIKKGNTFDFFSGDDISTINTVRWSFTENGGVVYVNDRQIGAITDQTRATRDRIVILGGTGSGSDIAGSIYLYEGQFREQEELVAHFQPCYRKSDGKIGLWDKIRGMFLPVNRDSAFEKGEDITFY